MKKSKRQRDIDQALKLFPKLVKQKRLNAEARKKFVLQTFGKIARQIDRQVRKSLRSSNS